MIQIKEEMSDNSHQLTNNNILNTNNNNILLTSMMNSSAIAATTGTLTNALSPSTKTVQIASPTIANLADFNGTNCLNPNYEHTFMSVNSSLHNSSNISNANINNNNNNTINNNTSSTASSINSSNSTANSVSNMQQTNGGAASPITMPTAEYLAQLIKDKKQLQAFPNVFIHLERILDEEINRVRNSLFQLHCGKSPLVLPDPEGNPISMQEKVYVPVKDHPDYNFVGRILGPRGMTAKQLELETGCKIMVRGRGSMRDKKKEEQNRGKPNWEHLNDELHVLITVEDTPNRAHLKINRAIEEVNQLLIPVTEGEDELKKRQLMELAIINGTYRDSNSKPINNGVLLDESLRIGLPFNLPTLTPLSTTARTTLGHPLIISPRIHVPTTTIMNGGAPPPLVNPGDPGLIYAASPYDFHQYISSPLLAEYPTIATATTENLQSGTGKQRRTISANVRDHPYQRPST